MGRIEDEQRHVQQTSDLHLATIEALARAIDAKDQTTQMHIRRVQVYAAGLAKAVGLSTHEIQGVKTAALLHDIGKLAVPEHILSKPGPLTQEEFQKIRIHPQVGAEIIAAVPFPYPVAPLILSHHERWDGKGYPQGLAGEEIPIGARILTIVDYYDAVTTERPYHKALQPRQRDRPAAARIGARARPDAGADLHRDAAGAGRRSSTPTRRARSPRRAPEPVVAGSTAVGLVPASGRNAFENIALAHREIYALYEIAQSMGTSLGVSDTMALISSKLSKIMPWSGCALFLHQPDSRLAEVPLRGGRRRAAAAERDDRRSARGCRAGSRATAARWSTPTRASRFEAAGLAGDIALQVGDRLPAAVQRHVHRLPGALPRRAEPLHRGSPPAARARSPNRPAPSSTTRSSSSRRRKIR